MFGIKGPVCQSCGMPLSKDANGGGTNADGTKSTEYCAHCYQDGAFTLPHISAPQMKDFVKGKLKEMHIPGFIAQIMVRSIPSLKRWKQEK